MCGAVLERKSANVALCVWSTFLVCSQFFQSTITTGTSINVARTYIVFSIAFLFLRSRTSASPCPSINDRTPVRMPAVPDIGLRPGASETVWSSDRTYPFFCCVVVFFCAATMTPVHSRRPCQRRTKTNNIERAAIVRCRSFERSSSLSPVSIGASAKY